MVKGIDMNPTCVICQYQCENQWGNNPAPIVNMAYGVCCDACNWEYVIPARMGRLSKGKLVALYEALGEKLGHVFRYTLGVPLGEEPDDACDTENDTVISNEEEE